MMLLSRLPVSCVTPSSFFARERALVTCAEPERHSLPPHARSLRACATGWPCTWRLVRETLLLVNALQFLVEPWRARLCTVLCIVLC